MQPVATQSNCSKRLVVSLIRQKGERNVSVQFSWRDLSQRQAIYGEVKRVGRLPRCFARQPAFLENEGWLLKGGQMGYIDYAFEGGTAIPYEYYPKDGLEGVRRLGYYLEAVALSVLRAEYEITSVRTPIRETEPPRKGQLVHVGLVNIDGHRLSEWLLGLGMGIREAVERDKEEFREREG